MSLSQDAKNRISKDLSMDELRMLILKLCEAVPSAQEWVEKSFEGKEPDLKYEPTQAKGGKRQDGKPQTQHEETHDPDTLAQVLAHMDVKGEEEPGDPIVYQPPLPKAAPAPVYNPTASSGSSAKETKPGSGSSGAAKSNQWKATVTPKDGPAANAAAVEPAVKPQHAVSAQSYSPQAAAASAAAAADAQQPNPFTAAAPNPFTAAPPPPQQVPQPAVVPRPVAAPAANGAGNGPWDGAPWAQNSMVFKASTATWNECIQKQLFGLPDNQWKRVEANVKVGSTALFLLNFQTFQIMGLFVATSEPGYNIDDKAWYGSMRARNPGSPFPAQVRVRQVRNWIPVEIEIIEHLLNWHKNGSTFDLTLDYEQTREVIRIMYEKQPANRK